ASDLCALADRRVAADRRRRARHRGAGRIRLALSVGHGPVRRRPGSASATEIRPRRHRDPGCRPRRRGAAGLLSPQPAEHLHRKADRTDARRRLRPGRDARRTIPLSADVDAVMRLSVLDLVPVRTDQTTSDALAATVRLAQTADRLGFTRYWVAEHHNMPSVGATSPPVLIAYLAAQTSQLRLGSGGVMLPNHAPLAVAEQFALLEAAAPGRIDLGIGRAPGSDPVTSILLRGAAGRDDRDIDQFPEYLDHVRAMMSARGVPVQLRDGDYMLKATPAAASEPRLWLLGSSMYSAQLAAAKGLPYVFAHHFSGHGTEEALGLYR